MAVRKGGMWLAWLVMLFSFLTSLCLLAGTNRLAACWDPWYRLALGASLGAVHSGACLVPGFGFLGGVHWRIICLLLMSAAAFGIGRDAWRRGGIFALLSMALGSIAGSAERGNGLQLLLGAIGIRLLSRYAFGGARQRIPVEIHAPGRTLKLTALRDTGNELRDPITGEPVLIIDSTSAAQLAGLTAAQLREPLTTMETACIPGLRLIPYRAVGVQSGFLLAILCPVVIGKRKRMLPVAFSPENFEGEAFQALAGGIL